MASRNEFRAADLVHAVDAGDFRCPPILSNQRAYPLTAWLSLSDACNNRCAWCYEQNTREHSEAESHASMDYSSACIALNALQGMGVRRCIFVGGEPTLNPSFPEIARLACTLFESCTLVTNARRAADLEYAHLLADTGLIEATVSMHGWSPDTYQGRQDSGVAFDEAVAGFHNLRSSGMKVGLNIVLGRHSRGHADSIADMVAGLGLRHFGANIAAPAVSRSRITGDFLLQMDESREHVLEVFSACRKKELGISFQLGLPLCLFSKSELQMLQKADAIKQGCHLLAGGGIVVKPNLALALCTHLTDFEIADSKTAITLMQDLEGFSSFWNNAELRRIRSLANVYRTPYCKLCDLWLECGGGCLVHWAYHDPGSIQMRYFDEPRNSDECNTSERV